jgi:REP-associated tyrosine transposase
MPRQPRLIVPEWPVHIIQRGSNRMACFRQQGDYLVYLALLRQVSSKTSCAVHAYCLMTNHIHLLVTPAKAAACSALMKALAQRYSYYFNRAHQRTGPLWEGRFYSCIVESSRYAIACHRYIELNPVRAGIVGHCGAYAWSSYAANSGSKADGFLSPHPEVVALGQAAYIRLLAEALGAETLREIRHATYGGYPLGSEAFKSTLTIHGERRMNRGRPGRPSKRAAESEETKSVSDTDLFSAGGAS